VRRLGLLFALSLISSLLSMRFPHARAVLFWIGWALTLFPVGLLVFAALLGSVMHLTVAPH